MDLLRTVAGPAYSLIQLPFGVYQLVCIDITVTGEAFETFGSRKYDVSPAVKMHSEMSQHRCMCPSH